LLSHATQFYKNLFGRAEDRGVRLNADIWDNAEKLLMTQTGRFYPEDLLKKKLRM
jgi:hypothetical protein